MTTTVTLTPVDAPRAIVPIPLTKHILGDISTTAVYELFKQGQLTKVNIGRRSFVTMDSITEYVERLKSAAEQIDRSKLGPFGRSAA
jgi:hypothetical protein